VGIRVAGAGGAKAQAGVARSKRGMAGGSR
jgi:hypothetical protein